MRTKQILTEKLCKVCQVTYFEPEEINKFHGRFCRLCHNKNYLLKNKARVELYKDYHRAYQAIFSREAYRKKQEALGKPVKKRAVKDDRDISEIKVKDYI
jgi:hypothetical protein